MATPQERTSALAGALAAEVARAMGALLGAAGAVGRCRPATSGSAGSFARRRPGPSGGTVVLGFDKVDGARLAKVVMGFDDEPDDAAVADMLQEVANQAFAALSRTPIAEGASFTTTGAVQQ